MAVPEKTETGSEPTMEEILASIRRIISEDGATVEAPPPPSDSILDLTEIMDAEKPAPPPPPPAEPVATTAPLILDMEDNVPDMPVPEIPETAPEPMPESNDRLVSEITAQAAASVISSAMPQAAHAGGLPVGNGGRTLESMVMELIRPVLKEWLDRNLPALVERVVQKEIRKITRDVG